MLTALKNELASGQPHAYFTVWYGCNYCIWVIENSEIVQRIELLPYLTVTATCNDIVLKACPASFTALYETHMTDEDEDGIIDILCNDDTAVTVNTEALTLNIPDLTELVLSPGESVGVNMILVGALSSEIMLCGIC